MSVIERPAAEVGDDSVVAREYRANASLLLRIAEGKFGVPHEEAEALVHDVFSTFLLHHASVRNARAWLVAAICNASRGYWRSKREFDDVGELDLPVDANTDSLFRQLLVRQAVDALRHRCKETLRMHYWEGRTAAELAGSFGTTLKYAEKLIHKCLKHTRNMLRGLERTDASR